MTRRRRDPLPNPYGPVAAWCWLMLVGMLVILFAWWVTS